MKEKKDLSVHQQEAQKLSLMKERDQINQNQE